MQLLEKQQSEPPKSKEEMFDNLVANLNKVQ